MKIRLLSDVHLEKGSFPIKDVGEDLIVLAGDINVKGRAINWIKESFKDLSKPVIYVPGNHEHYDQNVFKTITQLRESTVNTNIHVLDNDVFIFNGVRFIGFTLWTDYNLTGDQIGSKRAAKIEMRDFKYIRDKFYKRITPEYLMAENFKSRQFLEDQLSKPFDGKTVVVSHFAPSILSLNKKFIEEEKDMLASYATNMEKYFGEKINFWFHGHTHNSSNYNKNGTQVVCNPRGYFPKYLNADFNENLLLEV
jgi:predicted phosphodiesterase